MATYIMVEDVWRLKTSIPAYGGLVCSHKEESTFRYMNCPEKRCILNILVKIGKQVITDLLVKARHKSRKTNPPTRGD